MMDRSGLSLWGNTIMRGERICYFTSTEPLTGAERRDGYTLIDGYPGPFTAEWGVEVVFSSMFALNISPER